MEAVSKLLCRGVTNRPPAWWAAYFIKYPTVNIEAASAREELRPSRMTRAEWNNGTIILLKNQVVVPSCAQQMPAASEKMPI